MTANQCVIHPAVTGPDILLCFPVLQQLRPNLKIETFLPTIHRQQSLGYVLLMMKAEEKTVSVAGCRFGETLARGKYLNIDDFVTHADYQGCGYGRQLFEWIVKWAELSGCAQLHLDSGLRLTGAHRFYEKQQMTFASRHYSLKLRPV
jgi:GNAT superfamily N-acetyltransferase